MTTNKFDCRTCGASAYDTPVHPVQDKHWACRECDPMPNTTNKLHPRQLEAIQKRSAYDLRTGFHPNSDNAPYLAARAELAAADRAELLAELERLRENPADEYHTMDELYKYRMLYNAHATRGWIAAGIQVVKSWRHSDGEECFDGGWFIVCANLSTGQVTNHYPADHWDLFDCPEVDTAPEWDGHSSHQAAERLKAALTKTQTTTPPHQ